ncbi:uncharacterized protein A1O9_08071 [Exophiala aquamarina CBS 119918]|uniref:Uncharacterized protein n=1 Tax=Exophiala aquamarina CBS 119918 TaxID=1182545 RepID=A0A072PLS1_9EURO|nr:uncharacterized protein A1O9_08071 [Exophiala aquamarina CBS 119918]KEF56490.1 hypothetical protein A1O9_08071 [Exophiala aquamarina CBS 119918]
MTTTCSQILVSLIVRVPLQTTISTPLHQASFPLHGLNLAPTNAFHKQFQTAPVSKQTCQSLETPQKVRRWTQLCCQKAKRMMSRRCQLLVP